MLHFIHLSGARTGAVDDIDADELTLGRGNDCLVQFHPERDEAVSKHHARILLEGHRYLLKDLSRNGTYVNGRLVKEVWLRQGDVVRLGADGPQLKVDFTGKEVKSVLRSMRRKRWRVLWVPVVLLIIAGLGFGGIYLKRMWGRTVQTIEDEKAVLDDEIDALVLVIEEEQGGLGNLDAIAARYDRLVGLETDVEAVATQLQVSRKGDDVPVMDRQVDEVLAAFGEPNYRIPKSFREAVRSRIGSWLGTHELEGIFCASETEMLAMRPVMARYSFPEVLAFLPWVLSGGQAQSQRGDQVGLWAIGPDEGRELGLITEDGEDLRTDALRSTEAIAEQLQRDLQELSTSSVLLATVARDPAIAATVETLRERDAWTKGRRTARFLWMSRLLDEQAQERIPSLVAAAVIGRNPDHYGLNPENCRESDDSTQIYRASDEPTP